MTSNPNAPQGGAALPEVGREKTAIYEFVLDNLNHLRSDVRQRLAVLLGVREGRLADQLARNTNGIRDRALELLEQQDTGMRQLIDFNNHQIIGRGRRRLFGLLSSAPGDPSQIVLPLPGDPTLGQLVRNPRSADAQLLAYLFNNVFAAQQASLSVVFERLPDDAARQNLERLLRVRKVYDEINKEEFENLGHRGNIPHAGDPAIGKIGDQVTIMQDCTRERNDILNPGGPPLTPNAAAQIRETYKDRLTELSNTYSVAQREVVALEQKRGQLRSHLTEIQTLTGQFPAAGPRYTFNDNHMYNFDRRTTIDSGIPAAHRDVVFGTATASLGTWLRDDAFRRRADRFWRYQRSAGIGRALDASMILDELVSEYYEGRIDQENREAFLQQMRDALRSNKVLGGTAAAAAAPGAAPAAPGAAPAAPAAPGRPASAPSVQPGWAKRGAKAVGSYLSDFIFGAK